MYRESAATMKKLGLELGGNAPFIVFDDCNLEDAVAGAIASKFRNSGQTCICANRVLVQEGVYEAFVAKLVERVRAMKVSNGLEEDCDIGPLINRRRSTAVGRRWRTPWRRARAWSAVGRATRWAGCSTSRRC